MPDTSRSRARSAAPPRWWQEITFIGLSYLLYSMVRQGAPAQEGSALARAIQLDEFERQLGIAFEQSVNLAVAGMHWLVQICNYFYATAHFVVTIGVLVWLYVRRPAHYRSLRTVLYATNLIALVGFWLYPLAPPRMLVGFVDTVVQFRTWGSWGSGAVASASNQYAAMPSMHIGWALWCGIVVYRLGGRRWTRIADFVYPVLTLFVIVATANHFVLDAVGGALALAGGFGIQRLLTRRPAVAVSRWLGIPGQRRHSAMGAGDPQPTFSTAGDPQPGGNATAGDPQPVPLNPTGDPRSGRGGPGGRPGRAGAAGAGTGRSTSTAARPRP